jgi:hypothetical protein
LIRISATAREELHRVLSSDSASGKSVRILIDDYS